MQVHEAEKNFHQFGLLSLYHIMFFIIITTIGLNIVFGIILDTFSELRSNKVREWACMAGGEGVGFCSIMTNSD